MNMKYDSNNNNNIIIKETKRIAIIHPEGNILNNPNLTGIVEILCELGYSVDIYSSPQKFYQVAPCKGSRLILQKCFPLTGLYGELVSILSNIPGMHRLENLAKHPLVATDIYKRIPADLIIGVDDGIIEAARVAKVKDIPYGFISYELFFEEETSKQFKNLERNACENICFAVCQDPIRSKHLSKENWISLERIINIPVAGRGIKRGPKTYYLHDRLGIDRNKHIALCIGSAGLWARTSYLLESAQNWSDDWVLVIHPRYGINKAVKRFCKRYNYSQRIFFSLNPIPHYREFSKLVKSADIGIALYEVVPGANYAGNNLKYLGLSSGKIATYLQHGIPVVVNEVGILSEYVAKHELGFVVKDSITLPLPYELNGYEERCYQFFEQMLDLNKTIQPLLLKIKESLEPPC